MDCLRAFSSCGTAWVNQSDRWSGEIKGGLPLLRSESRAARNRLSGARGPEEARVEACRGEWGGGGG